MFIKSALAYGRKGNILQSESITSRLSREESSVMKTIAVSIALGALALTAVAPANAASAPSQTPISAGVDAAAVQDTDMSSHRRHWRRHHRFVRHYHPRYYRSYGYYPEPYYYRPAPVVSFGFGFGGPRFHRHHGHRW
jgi:hypothetical protein